MQVPLLPEQLFTWAQLDILQKVPLYPKLQVQVFGPEQFPFPLQFETSAHEKNWQFVPL